MKNALALLLLSCVLVAQDKPAAQAPKPAVVETDVNKKIDDLFAAEAAEKMRKQKLLQTPINVRDELIELIHQLKKDSGEAVRPPSVIELAPSLQASISASYDARMKAKTEAQRLLLQALVELAKDANKPSATIHHSSKEPFTGN